MRKVRVIRVISRLRVRVNECGEYWHPNRPGVIMVVTAPGLSGHQYDIQQ